MFNEQTLLWGGFTLFILAMLALDLGVLQRKPHVIQPKEALGWFVFWVSLALLFNLGVFLFHDRGSQAGIEFFTAFLVEKSLSLDNIFVFILIFHYFRVPPAFQHKVLFWGIVGAIIMRAIFILLGLAFLAKFHWGIYLFGGFLFITGITMILKKDQHVDPGRNWLVRMGRFIFPITEDYEGNRFFSKKNGKLFITPLFLVLLAVESSDIIFAIDSIPAVFAITPDPFIVYTSNIFALLGLRALYFAISGFLNTFYFLHYGFASIIIILAIKMLLSEVYNLPIMISLALIIVIILICVIISLLRPRKADLKILFERLEHLKLISFRRLLMFENVIDLGEIKVKDSMQPLAQVRVIKLNVDWSENQRMIRESRFSRYPLLESEGHYPVGIIHIKSLLFLKEKDINAAYIKSLARPNLFIQENLLLEEALTRFQRSYEQMAIVVNTHGQWTGIINLEDVLEEIVGRIGDEFDAARAGKFISLADALSPGRIIFDLEGNSLLAAIQNLLARIPATEFPVDSQTIIHAILERSATMPTFFGDGLAVPRGRIEGIDKPILAFARSLEGIPLDHNPKRAELIFLLLTPRGIARLQPQLLSDIIGLKDSDYVMERLRKTNSPEEVIEVLQAGQQVILD